MKLNSSNYWTKKLKKEWTRWPKPVKIVVTILSNERTQTIVCKTRRCTSERMTEAELKRESGRREEGKGRRDEKHHGVSGLLHAGFQLRSMKPCAWKAIKLQGYGAKDGTDKSTLKNRRIPEIAKWLPVPGLRGGPQLASECIKLINTSEEVHKPRPASTGQCWTAYWTAS